MTTPHTTGAGLATKIEDEFTQLRSEAENCEKLDKKYMDEHESFWDNVGEAIKNLFTEKSFLIPVMGPAGILAMAAFSANDARRAADDFYNETRRQMWLAYDDMCLYWKDELKDAAVGTDRLAQKADEWEAEEKNSIEQLLTDLHNVEKQDHWKGEGSEAYHKAIPSQRGALHELGMLVGRSAMVYRQGSHGLEIAYDSVKLAAKDARNELRRVPPVAASDEWGKRMLVATRAFKTITAQMTQINEKWMTQFGEDLQAVQHELVQHTETSAPFEHRQGKWPEARGDLSHMAPRDDQRV